MLVLSRTLQQSDVQAVRVQLYTCIGDVHLMQLPHAQSRVQRAVAVVFVDPLAAVMVTTKGSSIEPRTAASSGTQSGILARLVQV